MLEETEDGAALLAWSAAPDTPESPSLRSWRDAAGIAAVMVVCAVAAAGLVGWLGLSGAGSGAAAAPMASPAEQEQPPVIMPPPPVEVPDALSKVGSDDLFIVLLAQSGVTIVPGVNATAEAARTGAQICGYLDSGVSAAKIEADTVAYSRDASGAVTTPAQAHALVVAAERVYCPRYAGGLN